MINAHNKRCNGLVVVAPQRPLAAELRVMPLKKNSYLRNEEDKKTIFQIGIKE